MPPEKLPRPCATPGCKETLTFETGSRCKKHRRDYYRMELTRRTPNPFYKTALWQRSRIIYLRANPFCQAPGCRAPARVVDHIIPISIGGERLDPENFASMCDRDHNRKRSLEHHYPEYFLALLELAPDKRIKDDLIRGIFETCGGGNGR